MRRVSTRSYPARRNALMTIQVDTTGSLHTESKPGQFWSTTNLGEAMPGVASYLGWSIWGKGADLGIRDCFVRLGALPRSEVRPHRPGPQQAHLRHLLRPGRAERQLLLRDGRAAPGLGAGHDREAVAGRGSGRCATGPVQAPHGPRTDENAARDGDHPQGRHRPGQTHARLVGVHGAEAGDHGRSDREGHPGPRPTTGSPRPSRSRPVVCSSAFRASTTNCCC